MIPAPWNEEDHRDSYPRKSSFGSSSGVQGDKGKQPNSRTVSVSQLIGGINIQPNKKLGRVDLLVELPHHFILSEWKVVNIDSLVVGKSRDRELKVKTLSELYVDEVLGLKFNKRELHRKGTIEEWITPQLQSYVASVEAKYQRGGRKLHAYLVLIVGSRHILVWDMNEKGNWMGEPVLV